MASTKITPTPELSQDFQEVVIALMFLRNKLAADKRIFQAVNKLGSKLGEVRREIGV